VGTALRHVTALLAGTAVTGAVAAATAPAQEVATVCPTCPLQTIAAGVRAAGPGGTVRVVGGRVRGPLRLTQPVRLVGVDRPVLDGGGRGTVLRVDAADVEVRGFVIRGSGALLDEENAGITITRPGARIVGNRVEDVLFGINVEHAPGTMIRDNTIVGRPLGLADRGDGLRIFDSDATTVQGNRVRQVRDNLFWFSHDVRAVGNDVRDARYGLHLMRTDGALLSDNVLVDNAVGAYLMYGSRLRVVGNLTRHNRGPSGFGLGLRDVDALEVRANLIADNNVGMYISGSPHSIGVVNRFTDNVVAGNDTGLTLDSVQRGNVISANSLIDNTKQVSAPAEDSLAMIAWQAAGRGNYWSDYAGYDAGGDGVGDVPYAPRRSFERLADAHPRLALFKLSPAATAIDWAAAAFPVFRSGAQLVDRRPLVQPVIAAELPRPARSGSALGAAAALLLAVSGALALALRRRRHPKEEAPMLRPVHEIGAVLAVRRLTKAYHQNRAVDDVSFEVRPGEAVALWGANGAGKTTIVRCVLGLVGHDGTVAVAGHDTRRDRKAALRRLGYVAQEPAFHDDLTVDETLAFLGSLRGVEEGRADELLELTGLRAHREKNVGELSGGLRQRLALAVALLGRPDVLLLDEPTANLDAASRRDMIALLVELKEAGTALLLAAHHVHEITAVADRVLLLDHGALVAERPVAAFARDAAHEADLVEVAR